MKNILILFLLVLVACEKNVSRQTEQSLIQSPNLSDPNQNLPISPTIPVKTVIVPFSNHAEVGSYDSLPTSFKVSYPLTLNIPLSSNSVSNKNSSNNRIYLYVNQSMICSFEWKNQQYEIDQNCPLKMNLQQNDQIYFLGIKAGETVSFVLTYLEN